MGRPAHIAKTSKELLTPSRDGASSSLLAPALVMLAIYVVQGFFLALSHPAVRVVLLVVAGCLGTAAIIVVAWRAQRSDRNVSEALFWVFTISFFVLGLLYMVVFPPGTVPDEDIHYSASYSYANLLDPTMGPHDVRKEDYEFTHDETLYSHEVKPDFWLWQKSGQSLLATHAGTVRDDKFAHDIDFGTDAPQLKVFSALGILVARLCNLNGVMQFFMGRLFNYLSCFALVVLAIRLLPLGRNIMMTITLLPMTLHLFGSYSYDAMIIALSFLLVSLILRAALGEGGMSRGLAVGSVVVAVLLAPCKIVYYSLALLSLMVPERRFASRRMTWVWKGCMLCLPALAIVAMRAGKLIVMAGMGAQENMAIRRSSTTPIYSLRDIVARPLSVFEMTVRAIYRHGDFYLSSLVGASLGWFQGNIAAYTAQEVGLVVAVLVSSCAAADDSDVLPASMRGTCLGVFGAGMLLVFFSMTLIWTTVGSDVVQGVQGRYFIPLLPVLLLGIRGRTIQSSKGLGFALVATLAGFACIYLAQITFFVLGGAI